MQKMMFEVKRHPVFPQLNMCNQLDWWMPMQQYLRQHLLDLRVTLSRVVSNLLELVLCALVVVVELVIVVEVLVLVGLVVVVVVLLVVELVLVGLVDVDVDMSVDETGSLKSKQ
jgi:hypothetical protein